jgi:uncharacterized protein YcbK (DUF882 family)
MALLIAAALVFFVGTSVSVASASGNRSAKKSSVTKRVVKKKAKKHRRSDKGTTKVCSKVKGKRRCKRIAVFSGHGAAKSTLRTSALERPSGNIWIYAENLVEEVKVNIYRADGSFDEAALAKLDDLFRCVRTGEVRAVRPELYEQLSRIYDHFDHKQISLVSGFRFAERNSSRHYHASAMDIRIPGVSINTMYAYAESLDQGGMGIGLYPTSQFIHVDFRAPGEPSYRWTDYSGHGGSKHHKKKKSTGRTHPARKTTS